MVMIATRSDKENNDRMVDEIVNGRKKTAFEAGKSNGKAAEDED